MADWTFDEGRFVEEVLKPIKDGWQPTDDLFRVYLLAETVSDPDTISAALDGVFRALGGPRLERGFATSVARIRAGHEKAKAVLGDQGPRRAHATEVRARRERLQAALADRLAGAPGLPQRVIMSIVAESRGSHTRREIRLALSELSAGERDPEELPPATAPGQWGQLRGKLSELGQPGLWEYLEQTPGLSGPGTTLDELAKRTQEVRKRRDAATAAESSAIEFLRTIVQGGQLKDALRFELYESLQQSAGYRYPVVLESAKAAAGRLRPLGLPDRPDLVAYAMWCRRRYDESGGGSGSKAALREALEGRDLRRAVAVLGSAGKLSADDERQLKRLKERLTALDAELKQAAGLERSDPEAAAQAYLTVAKELADPAIEAGLARCTPPPPTEVVARLEHQQVRLSWRPGPARAGRITYTVVRASGARPANPGDGTALATDRAGTELVDQAPPAAQNLTYAVFTVRESGAVSTPAYGGPVIVLPEVSDLTLEPSSDTISGRWRPPAGAAGIDVTRVAPGGRSGPVAQARSNGFSDVDVRSGERYEYRVQVRYRLPDGSVRKTAGLTAEGSCQEVPEAVTALEVRLDGEDLVVSWRPPPRGEVEIRDVSGSSAPTPGVVPASSVDDLGRRLANVSMRKRGSVRGRPAAGAGRLSLLAVTVLGDLAAVGTTQTVDRRLRPVTALRAVRQGTDVELTWVWPEGAHEARVLYGGTGPATGPRDVSGKRHDVTRVAYDAVGVRLPIGDGTAYFSVCTRSSEGREETFGPLVSITEQSVHEVRYRIVKGGWRARHKRVLTAGSPEGPALPALALVAKARTRPIVRSDGLELFRLPGGAAELEHEFTVPETLSRPVHLRVFSLEPGVVLVPEQTDQLIVT